LNGVGGSTEVRTLPFTERADESSKYKALMHVQNNIKKYFLSLLPNLSCKVRCQATCFS
jgi:hypothetical protein